MEIITIILAVGFLFVIGYLRAIWQELRVIRSKQE